MPGGWNSPHALPGGGRVLRLRSNRDPDPALRWHSATLKLEQSNGAWTARLAPGEHLITLSHGGQEISARLTVVED